MKKLLDLKKILSNLELEKKRAWHYHRSDTPTSPRAILLHSSWLGDRVMNHTVMSLKLKYWLERCFLWCSVNFCIKPKNPEKVVLVLIMKKMKIWTSQTISIFMTNIGPNTKEHLPIQYVIWLKGLDLLERVPG